MSPCPATPPHPYKFCLQAGFVEQLRQFVVFAEEGEGAGVAAASGATRTQLTPAGAVSLGLRSPLLKPLSPPPADAEVQRLEKEVTAASLRVAELRTSMQAQLQEQLAAKLAVCRPTAELEEGEQQQGAAAQTAGQSQEAPVEGAEAAPQQAQEQEQAEAAQQAAKAMAGGDGTAAAGTAALSPQPEDLQQRLLQATNRMPALRARLEQATDKLQRVVAAVAADISRPPPNTVEKAVVGKTPGRLPASAAKAAGTAAGAENEPRVSPLFQQVRQQLEMVVAAMVVVAMSGRQLHTCLGRLLPGSHSSQSLPAPC